MFKGNKKYYFVLGTILLVVVVLQYLQPKPINWKRSYNRNDKIPFGCYAIFGLLKNFAADVKVNKVTTYELNESKPGTGNALIVVNENLEMSALDTRSLLLFIEKGNTVVLSANQFGRVLEDTLHLETAYNYYFSTGPLDSMLKKPAFEIKYVQPNNNLKNKYKYPAVATESYFTKFDTATYRIVAVNKAQKPVILSKKTGKGKLIVCSLPDVFGNLFIVDHQNRYFTYTLLSMLNTKTIIWDEFYKPYKIREKGLFQFIFESDPLYMAYCIFILTLIVFMVFEMKRRQRSIPVIDPPKNTTLEFIDVVSHVYFNSSNHKYIAGEAIHYFYFDIRRKFGVNTTMINADFYTTMHRLSGVAFEEVKNLFTYCENIKNAPLLTQNDLLELNNRINKFKQKSIR